jgi:hypothetical protein
MLLNKNISLGRKSAKHFIFQVVIRHRAYEHPEDYLPYSIEPEGLIKCRISKEGKNI